MQKWEYLFVVCEYERGQWRPQYVNGRELRDWKNGPTISDYANQLGDEGWELVAAPYTGGAAFGTYARLVFKRPKP